MKSEDIKTSENYAYSGSGGMEEFYDEILSYPQEERHNRWSVSWADLMMTMFIFFAVMYIYQTGNRELLFGKGPGKNFLSDSGSQTVVNIGVDQNPSQVYDQAKQAISEVMLAGQDSVELMKEGAVRIVLAGDLLFDPGKADLKIGAQYQLNQLARVLNENDFAINVVGHSDDAPTRSEEFPTNWELSSKRAVMVARYLTEVTKVDETRVFISSHSFFQPVRDNDTAYNRSLNRRVEIVLVKQKPYSKSNN